MFNYLPQQWLFLFFFYSFLGWIFETAYVTIHEKHFINRGFMRGPFLPLYGSGGIMMLLVSRPFYENVFLVYIAGCIGATALEYVTGFVMEKLFKVRYWDYSHKRFHFQGYISLESTLAWGVCTVVFSHYLQVPVEKMLLAIPYRFLSVVTIIITVAMTIDFVLAFKTALDLRDVLMYMEKAKSEMQRMQKRLDVIIAFKGEEVREGIGARVEGIGNAAQGIGNAAYAIGSGVGNAASAIKSEVGAGIGNAASAISSGIGSRMDVISEKLEKTFAAVKEKMKVDPGAYVGNAREEVLELYAKYRVMMSRFTPGPVKNFFEWYRERTIVGNPTMSSEEYKASLEEVKEHAKKGK
ncbi:MAG: hypothetical protein IJU77_01925 [Butyrivibrio sp.]|nr:hypothetical protein [Butyrivibrio sp.]